MVTPRTGLDDPVEAGVDKHAGHADVRGRPVDPKAGGLDRVRLERGRACDPRVLPPSRSIPLEEATVLLADPPAADQHVAYRTGHLEPLVRREVARVMQVRLAHPSLHPGIPEHEVGIASNLDRALRR